LKRKGAACWISVAQSSRKDGVGEYHEKTAEVPAASSHATSGGPGTEKGREGAAAAFGIGSEGKPVGVSR